MSALAGRVVIVAGASSGIGRATAALLAERGARVHALARRRPTIPGTEGQALDVTNRAAVDAAVHEIAGRGTIDALIYCAGTNVSERRLAELTPTAWDEVIATNLTGAFNMVRAALPHLRRSRGDVVLLSSVSARWPDASGPAYQASKGGLSSFAHGIALEEQEHGIRVCSIEPGAVNTPLMERRPRPPDAATRARMLEPEDVAEACAFVLGLPKRAAVPVLVILPSALQVLGRTS